MNQKSTSKNKRENKTRRRDTRKKNHHKRNRVQETVTPETLEVTYKGLRMFGGIGLFLKIARHCYSKIQ